MLWRGLNIFQVFGANTDVGKTIVSTLLCRALQRRAPPNGLLYLKPVSTGPTEEADDRHIARYAPGVDSKCISQFSRPVSPHIAARSTEQSDQLLRSDKSILSQIKNLAGSHAQRGGRYAILETAGGILSPGPSGTLQADLYRPLRLPVVLVGDYKLGGIATTISAFESLHVRGYDLHSVILFDEPKWGNAEFLHTHFKKHDIQTFALPMPPPRLENRIEDELAMEEYYGNCSSSVPIGNLVDVLNKNHHFRISKLSSMQPHADSIIWHPFRQYGLPQHVVAIDSAYGDYFEAYNTNPEEEILKQCTSAPASLSPASVYSSSEPVLTPLFDGSASWWTQGLGHGNVDLALTAAHAAGRYGHVMFGNAVHAPALDVSYSLLSTIANPRLSRVFFTDNGSTGMEVAVKMALRASCVRYSWAKEDGEIGILGLAGSYHGDTIGVMNCAEPNVFNEAVDWYKPWGFWFNPPHLKMRKGVWELTLPAEMNSSLQPETQRFANLEEVFDYQTRSTDRQSYEEFVKSTLKRLVEKEGRRFGALIMEPIIMGAGGMIFVDPLFQRTLIKVVRENSDLISPKTSSCSPVQTSQTDWSGLPVIADEVFTGLYRLGRPSSSSFLSSDPTTTPHNLEVSIAPDISVHAKLLTGGLLPLAMTTASESIFNVFVSERKEDALLHGHSYTAHAVGCAVADRSLKEIKKLEKGAAWHGYKSAWNNISPAPSPLNQQPGPPPPSPSFTTSPTFSFFSPTFLTTLSHHPRISGCFALGTVLAMTVTTPAPPSTSNSESHPSSSTGYTSTAATSLQSSLLTELDEEGRGIHSRVLGDVLYLMTSLTTKPEEVVRIERAVLKALK